MAISWYTKMEADSMVYYDTKPHDKLEDYAYKERGVHKQIRATDVIFKNWYHDVILRNLKPATTYYFVCGSPVGWSDVKKFKTLDPQKDIRFGFIADSRRRGEGRYEIEGPAYPDARIFVAQGLAAKNPNFVAFGGDMIMSGHEEWEWEAWFEDIPGNLIASDGCIIPMVPAIGNHDLARYKIPGKQYDVTDETDYDIFTGLFALPDNELWFALNFKDLRFVTLATAGGIKQKGLSTGDRVKREAEKQVFFLRKQLETNDKKWFITQTHYSINGGYGIKPGDGGWGLIDTWVPLYEKYKVPLVLTAHSHHYMRSWPLKRFAIGQDFVDFGKNLELWPKGPPIIEMANDSREGVTYIVQGNCGADTEWFEDGTAIRIYPWMAAAYSRPSFTLVEIKGDQCYVVTETVGTNVEKDHLRPRGYVLDEFTLPYTTEDFPMAKYNVAF
jgi:hypothetical protein